MSRLHEPIKRHIHSELCTRVNEFIINVKIHQLDISNESATQQAKIIEARKRKALPTWDDVVSILTDVRNEMDTCTEDYKRY